METVDLSLLDLPDDALLAVLAYLPPAELLGCRVVCRRLRDLCLHRHLWKSAAIGCELLPALRVVPCLRKLSFVNPEQMVTLAQMKKMPSLLASTECVVAELEVRADVYFAGPEVPLATAMVKKFSALGGLRALRLSFFSLMDSHSLALLLKAALGVSGLRELGIGLCSRIPSHPALWSLTLKRPSLTKLQYVGKLNYVLVQLLTTHASTLEDVSVCLGTDHLPMNFLRMMPRLRSLECKADALSYSAALSNLNTLKFINEDLPPDFPSSALDFLSQAPHLRSVSFPVPRKNHAAPLQALASSPSARFVESLTLSCVGWDLDAIGVELAANIVPLFPSLQSLSLECWLHGDDLDGFLQAVTPTSAPSLTSLSMNPPLGECAHGWLHSPAVQELLERNPRLHLRVLIRNQAECRCEWCGLGCHEELRKLDDLQHLAMAAHRRMAGCPTGCRRWP
ncbi:uncharacterized protein LOC117647176 [Thrips palmi]|uniref:Uncharacterized protein LOC117647176 n=1 Tax=Thrips palmi TaxID=161013 RepID=A0A6P8YX04_THRPL|nr:uncharacterized protein LOC117647176 [Thrips palmi]XP_034244677.1 uncharacterized protein LOC117647176 [Thrips palmi]XP_034244678.1 uncharacterized protein LOC117647176 [Thrips palmi]XP_034244679.1 uncharacterized protein LOC117647176 [Thrips palmi]XP_034244680.1 uncharacterized protein LOC117647176 [Thrips palmi]XP_034244681.1 uncharacterized protein LOC117647176 [Thrips palmi]XP_034244682.1 uncharacterized protein LOC117647176 [Thrips palmi]XP_034244683.1 uncharacterized protein LOC1176